MDSEGSSELQSDQTFRHMFEGLLSEVRVSPKLLTDRNEGFQPWLLKLIKALSKLKDEEIDLKKWTDAIPLPRGIDVEAIGSKYQWKKPTDVNAIGSWAHQTAFNKISAVDLSIVMPKECLHKSDLLNHKYHVKRALYLAYVAKKLQGLGYKGLQFVCPDGNPLKPVLEILTDQELSVRLHLVPPEDFFKLSRLSPEKNNLRFNAFYKNSNLSEAESCSKATPQYNCSIAVDVLLQSTNEMLSKHLLESRPLREASLLLKIWLQQRSLNKGYGSFSNTIVSLLLCYLMEKQEIHDTMNSLQILKAVLNHLSHSEWDSQGISFTVDEEALKNWKSHSEVMFIDSTGILNYASQMSKLTYQRVKHEALQTLLTLSDFSLPNFQSVFIKQPSFLYNFDHVLQLKEKQLEQEILAKEDLRWTVLNHSGDTRPVAISLIGKLIQKCFGARLQFVDVDIPNIEPWKCPERPSFKIKNSSLRFGLIINREEAQKQVEKCPSDDAEAVNEFKEFWGEISELRRFRDGSISESVVFSENKERVCFEMFKYTLKRHLNLDLDSSVTSYLDNQLDALFDPQFTRVEPDSAEMSKINRKRKKPSSESKSAETVPVSVDDVTNDVAASVDKLAKNLRQLEALPLAITSVQGVSPVIRYTNPFPTPPQRFFTSELLLYHHPQMKSAALIKVPGRKGKPGTFVLNKMVKYVDPICLVLQLEATGKWPDNLEAIEHLKCALLVNVGQSLRSQFGLNVQATPQFLDVLMDGFVFRIRLFYMRELMLQKEVKDADGVIKIKDNIFAQDLEKEGVHLPKLTSTLNAFRHQCECFGRTCRLAKRWLASHLLLSPPFTFQNRSDAATAFTEEAVELLVASTFINHKPFLHPPHTSQTGFLRFLNLLATTDWKLTPILVNFNQTFTLEELQDIDRDFSRRREAFPPLFIATPHDRQTSMWTRQLPKILLKRSAVLAQTALKHLTGQLLSNYSDSAELQKSAAKIFSSPMDHFDVVIWLTKHMSSKSYQNIHGAPAPKLTFKKYVKTKDEFIPIVAFDPAGLYLQELRDSFGHLAMFFTDLYGGNCIAVVWKPDVLKPKEFSVTNVKERRLNEAGMLEVNAEGVIEAFQVLGEGIIERIETKSENWKM